MNAAILVCLLMRNHKLNFKHLVADIQIQTYFIDKFSTEENYSINREFLLPAKISTSRTSTLREPRSL